MPFEYPLASKAVLEGSEFYRITRNLYEGDSESVFGSMIGIDVGFNAIVVGPDSDYEAYEMYYPDPSIEGGIAFAEFSVGSPFVGAIAVDAAGSYDDTFGTQKIAWVKPRQALFLAPDVLGGQFIIPTIDIIAYTGKVPIEIPAERSVNRKDGFFKTQLAGDNEGGHVLLGYGRKNFTAHVINNSAVAVDVVITGIMVGNGDILNSPGGGGESPIGEAQKQIILASTVVPAKVGALQGALCFSHDAVADGYFDYYLVEATSASTTLPSDGSTTAVYISMEVQD